MYIRVPRAAARLAGLLLWLVAVVVLLPAVARADAPLPRVQIDARLQPDGTVLFTEQRTIAGPRSVEFAEYLVPAGAVFDLQSVQDQSGPFTAAQPENLQTRNYHIERQGQVAYLEWRPDTGQNEQVTITYRLTGALVLHQDAVEWYWPALTGSGGRGVLRVDAAIHLPSPAQAYLYAYGGEAGGVRIGSDLLQATATNLRADRPFEWRLLADRRAFPGLTGTPVPGSLATLRQVEADRTAAQMSGATRRWLAHGLILLAPFLLIYLYIAVVRRRQPYPAPDQLSPAELSSVPPAVVGWVYDSPPLDIATAQIMHLQRQGAVSWRFRQGGDDPTYEGDVLEIVAAGPRTLGAADQALLRYFHLEEGESRTVEEIANRSSTLSTQNIRERAWLQAVQAEVPADWLERSPALPLAILIGVYVVMGVVSGAWVEWLLLWAIALLLGLMLWKRRWLSALGEAHVARWVSLYSAAVSPRGGTPTSHMLKEIPAEYLLAAGVGDQPLEHQMGAARYAVVKALYLHLDR